MKRFLLFLASLSALSVSGCCMGFEPGVGFYWKEEASLECARKTPGFIAAMGIAGVLGALDQDTEEEEQREFFGH